MKLAAVGCFAILLSSTNSQAQRWFDLNGPTAGFALNGGNTYGWSNTSTNWTPSFEGTVATVTWDSLSGASNFVTSGSGGINVDVTGSNRDLSAGLTKSGSPGMTIRASGALIEYTLGGNVDVSGGTLGFGIVSGGSYSISGDFTKVGVGSMFLSAFGSSGAAYSGTATIEAGGVQASVVGAFSANSHFHLTGGALRIQISGTGHQTVQAGNLSGTSGSVIGFSSGTTQASYRFVFNQTSDATYSGAFTGFNSGGDWTASLGMTKAGDGDLTLEGASDVDFRETLAVSGGALLANKSITARATNATVSTDTTAVLVQNGGTLGGSGTISTSAVNENVVVQNGGRLAPGGILGETGTLTFTLGSGVLDISEIGAGGLRFDLAGIGASDLVAITTGTLNIGTGNLNFGSFDINALSGFGVGEYVLFSSSNAINGTFGAGLTGSINGLEASLGMNLAGNSLVLTVIPEPSAVSLGLVGLLALALARRFRRSSSRNVA